MVGERLGGGERGNNLEGNEQDTGKKVLELSVIPEGMTVEQYSDYLNGMTDKFGNPMFSTSTRETLVGKYAKGELVGRAINPVAEASAEQIEKANAAAERDQKAEVEKILAGREATEALDSIKNEIQELNWAKWNLEQFLASHWDRLTAEGTTTYSGQLDSIKARIQELTEDKGTLEREFNLAEKTLPSMGERAAIDANEAVQRDQEKLMTAMGHMLEKQREQNAEARSTFLATESGAQPEPEEFTDRERAEWFQTLKKATDPNDPNAFRTGEWMSDEEKAELRANQKAERREALKQEVSEKVKYRAPWRRLATQALAGVLLAGTLFSSFGADANAAEVSKEFGSGKSPKEAEGGEETIKSKQSVHGRELGVGIRTGSEALKTVATATTSENRNVDQSFEEWALARGNEIYAGFENEEGTQIGKFGEMANYTKGWDLNEPGSNHFGPSLAVLVDDAEKAGKAPEEALPAVIEGLMQNYRNQPECNMAYISKFPALLAECGVSEDIINIKDVNKRTDALIDLWHSKDGGLDLQKKLIAATELTLTSQDTQMDLFRSKDKVSVDYLRLKPGATKSGVNNMEIKQDIKQRKGEWALTITYGNGIITVFLRCGGQDGEKIKEGQKRRYTPTIVTIETENLTDEEKELVEEIIGETVNEQSEIITEDNEQPDDGQPEEKQDDEENKKKEDDEEKKTNDEETDDENTDDEETNEKEVTNDSKDPNAATKVLNEDKMTDGEADPTEDVEEVETETELENVQPEEGDREQVNENIVQDKEGDAEKQVEIDAETNNENIEDEEAQADAILDFTNRLNGEGDNGEGEQ